MWKVEYDGPSRPIITGPQNQMFSISKFIHGQWSSFADEEKACQLFCDKLNELEKQQTFACQTGQQLGRESILKETE